MSKIAISEFLFGKIKTEKFLNELKKRKNKK